MKKTILTISTVFIFGALLITSCKKKSADPEPEETSTTTGGNTAAASGFTWTQSGGAENVADSAFYVEGGWGSGIRAYKGGSLKFEINFTATTLTASTYTFSAAYGLTFIANGNYYDDKSSVFNITSVSNNKASGNYSGTAVYTGSSSTSSIPLTIQFKDISKK